MTRRGSLAYYLAAWICGCVFMSVCLWVWTVLITAGKAPGEYSVQGVSGLLFVVFLGFLSGSAAAFLSAFLLRRLMNALRWRGATQWTAAGAVLTPTVIAVLGEIDRVLNPLAAPKLTEFLTSGPAMVLAVGWWLAIPAGAATAYILYRIDRAFAPQSQASDQPATVAGGQS